MKFKIGEIVRYDNGSTALMKIESVIDNGSHLGPRYYGSQFYGHAVGAYENELKIATSNEIVKFKTDNHVGRLRDYPELAK